jgi:6-phosphogluconolactonase
VRVVIGDVPALSAALTDLVAGSARAAIASRGHFSIAVPGGSVAATFLPRLAHAAIDWARTELFWVDERAVPPEHSDSNYIQTSPLRAIVPEGNVHRIKGEAADILSEARRYSDELILVLGDPPTFDLVLLGAGPDGHVASLFPGRPLTGPAGQYALAITDSPKPPSTRVTLTMPALTTARDLALVVMGADKAAMVSDVLEGSLHALPASAAVHGAARAALMLDFEAASRLSEATRRFWNRLR